MQGYCLLLGILNRLKMENPKKTLYLVDISSLFFRSYYAVPPMTNEKGLPVGALFGVMKMLNQLSRKKSPDSLISCFDTKTPSFRKKIYPAYKANRSEMPEDLEVQVPYLKKMMDCLLIPSWEKPGFEADDLIASLAKKGKESGFAVHIVSGDKDFAQIVDSSVSLYDSMKDIVYDPQGVQNKWHVLPSQMKDYLSLTGDASDNIPGVSGVGPKGAARLLKTYGSLNGIYKNLNTIRGSVGKKLAEGHENAFLSQKLITLNTDIPYKGSFETHRLPALFSLEEKRDLKSFLEELNFKSFIRAFFTIKTESPRPSKNATQVFEKPSSTEQSSPSKNQDSIAETGTKSSLSSAKAYPLSPPRRAKALSRSKFKLLSLEDFKKNLPPYASVWIGAHNHLFYLRCNKQFSQLSEGEWKDIAGFLDYKQTRFLGHDLKFFWKTLGIKNPVAEWDSLIAGHLLSSKPDPSFEKLCQRHLGIQLEPNHLPEIFYAQEQLKDILTQKLEREEMASLFQDTELPLIAVLLDMETKGVLIDGEEIKKQSLDLERDLKELEFQICTLAKGAFNLSSPRQTAEVLFDRLGLPKGRKTKTGWSTDSHELMKIQKLHPILPLLLEYRELYRLKSTYTSSLLELRDLQTGRVHTEFKQAVTATGRLSSVHPNLQNIPIRTERGRRIRKAFVAPQDMLLLSADYSQIELRILAHITGDTGLKKAFARGGDIHSETACEIFNIPLNEVSSDLRRKSKAVNFGIAYGQGAFGLSQALSISRSEAGQIIENYFTKFPKIKDWMEAVKEDLPKKHYVVSPWGRKRFFDPQNLKHPRMKSSEERSAINAPLQAGAGDLIKKAMIELNKSLPIPIVLQVHDELLFECPKQQMAFESREIRTIMEKDSLLQIPLKIHLSSGKNWLTREG